MQAGRQLSLLGTVILAIILTPMPAWAQNLNPQQKIGYASAAVKAAEDELAKGNTDRARLILLSVMQAVRDLAPAAQQVPQVKAIVDGYMAQRNRAWPGAPAQLTEESLTAFLQAYETDKTRLAGLGKFYDYDNEIPNGVQAYRRKIAQMLARRESAWKAADALSAAAPPPDHLLSNQAVFQKIWGLGIPKILFYVTFGPAIAAQHAQQRVIPETLKDVRTEIAASKQQQDPGGIWSHMGRVDDALNILETIEVALRKEEGINLGSLAADVASLRKDVEAESKRAQVLKDKEIDANRVPGDRWSGEDHEGVLKMIRLAYAGAFPDEKVKRITMQSGAWGERWETWWDGDVLMSAYFAYAKAAIVVKQSNGDHRVFLKWFRRSRNADGSWSSLGYNKNLGSYLIRAENINE